jgi:hypothetical protein
MSFAERGVERFASLVQLGLGGAQPERRLLRRFQLVRQPGTWLSTPSRHAPRFKGSPRAPAVAAADPVTSARAIDISTSTLAYSAMSSCGSIERG